MGELSSNTEMNPANEQQIIAKILKGETNTYGVLVRQYKGLVFTLAMQMLRQKEEAEEVAQDAFVKAYRNLGSFKGDAKFSTWLYKITYNACLDALKKRGRRASEVEIDEITAHEVKTMDTALDVLMQKEREELIKDALSELAYENSVLLTLFYFEELSLKEISKIMGKSVNVLKVKLFRSRKQLAVILKGKLTVEEIASYGRK